MKFLVNCAADLYQQKINLELAFPAFPSIGDLQRQVETVFSIESSVLRPPGQPFAAFKLSRFQMFDERLGQWVDLISSSQLYEGVQIYAFQPHSERSEQQRQIPPARPPSSASLVRGAGNSGGAQLSASPIPSASSRVTLSPPRPAHPPSPAAVLHSSSLAPVNLSSALAQSSSTSFEITGNTLHRTSTTATSVMSNSHAALPNPAANRFLESASLDTKARVVFDEIDNNRNRLIEIEEMRRIFKLLNLDFSAATINDLFARADSDRDGVVSMGEWQHFSQYYPTLVDSLYFRSKEYYDEQRRRQLLSSQQQQGEDSRLKERQVAQALDDARRDLATQEKALNIAEQDLQNKLIKERDSRALAGEAKKDVERGTAVRADRERDLAGGRDRERQRHSAVLEAQRGVEANEKRLAAQESDVSRAQEKERQLEALLAEARRETERQLKAMQMCAAELTGSRDREQQALSVFSDAQHEVHRLQDTLAQAELELARRAEKERETEAILAEAQREAARAAHRREEDERELQLQRERELHHVRLHQDAQRAIEDAERQLRQIEKDLADYLARRQQIELQENELIEQEIRLREQRFNLEEREGKLRTQAATFCMSAGRIGGLSGSQVGGGDSQLSYRSPARGLAL